MDKFAKSVVEKRKIFLVLFAILTLISIILIPMVKVNYDNTKYLPEDMETKKALSLMEEEFGLKGYAQVMFADVDVPQALELKSQVSAISGVDSVIWLDDVFDLTQPLSYLDQGVVTQHYKEGNALFQVNFREDDHSLKTGDALVEIRELAPNIVSIEGPAMNAMSTRTMTSSEILQITLLLLPILLIILLMFTNSWFEPVLFLTVIGVSVLINMGTNAFVGEISYITQSSASLLQLAIAMDYSIFLLHRFGEERARGLHALEAMTEALRRSFAAILSSALTTVAGFVALMFMRYQIGFDMGLVLAKGILFSLISVVLLMPALIIMSEGLIEATKHRSFMPSLKGFARVIIKLRYVIPLMIILLLVPAFLAQGSNHFLYGEAATAASDGTPLALEKENIEDTFGLSNRTVLLIPKGNIPYEIALAERLTNIFNVKDIQSLVTLADPAVPREILPKAFRENFEGDNYTRMIISLNTEPESPAAFTAVDQIRDVAQEYYPDEYVLLGSSASLNDIKTVVESDLLTVSMISIFAVGLILLLTFRSISIPVILVFAIQSSIWINMSIPYFMGSPLVFIGYMIVGAVQLGATIDYAILLTSRYKENRRTLLKQEALIKAIDDAGNSIITSASILGAAGFMLGIVSSVSVISSLGILIGRGALLSALLVLIFLPQLLMIFDGIISKTTLEHGFFAETQSAYSKGVNKNGVE